MSLSGHMEGHAMVVQKLHSGGSKMLKKVVVDEKGG